MPRAEIDLRTEKSDAIGESPLSSESVRTAFVAIVMGSKSDWDVMKHAADTLDQLGVPNEARALSAHRTPEALFEYIAAAEQRGAEAIIAGAGGAAHLPGVVASKTLLPVIGVPIESVLQGLDSLLSIVQMPGGIPVATMAIGKAGAINAGLFAAAILARREERLLDALRRYRADRAAKVIKDAALKEMKGE